MEPPRAVEERGPAIRDFGMQGMEWKRDMLFKRLPAAVRIGLADLNARAAAELSASDYLQVLEGEDYLHSHRSQQGLSQEEALAQLKEKVQAILDNPQNEDVFARTHFMDSAKDGVSFRYNLLYTRDSLLYADDEYIVEGGSGLLSGGGFSSLIKVWDARTLRLVDEVAFPSQVNVVSRLADGNSFFIPPCMTEGQRLTWAGQEACSVVNLSTRQVLPLTFSYDHPDKSHEEAGVLRQFGSVIDLQERYTRFGRTHKPKGLALIGYTRGDSDEYNRNTALRFYAKGSFPNRKGLLSFALRREGAGEEDVCSIDFMHLTQSVRKQDVSKYRDVRSPNLPAGHSLVSDDASVRSCSDPLLRTMDSKGLFFEGLNENSGVETWPLAGGYRFFSAGYGEELNASLTYQFAGLLSPSGEALLFNPAAALRGDRQAWEEGQTHALLPLARLTNPDDFYCSYVNVVTYGVFSEMLANGDMEIVLLGRYDGNAYGAVLMRLDATGTRITLVKHWHAAAGELAPVWLPEKRMLFMPEGDRKYNIFTVDHSGSSSPVATLYLEPLKRGYAVVLPNGHYAGSPGCEAFLSFTKMGLTVGMEALAPWRNRPAEILAALGGDPDDIAALQETTRRWLRKAGYDADNMPPEPSPFALPVAKVQLPPLYPESSEVTFKVELRATARSIRRVCVRADGVEVPQAEPVNVPAGESATVTMRVPLAAGQNWLEVTAEDSSGLKGETTRFRVVNEHAQEPQLYVIAMGVSAYRDEALRLQYAAKDAQDVAECFRRTVGPAAHVCCLTDDEVCRESALSKMEGFLAAANIDDIVVVYIAGHGFLDAGLNYYYAPVDTDVDRLQETAISMDELTNTLQHCVSRHRLLLMDTCHAGTLGEEGADKLAALGMNLPQGVRAVQTRGMRVKGTPALQTAAGRKRYIEEMYAADNTQRGINIIAGSAGAEFARESERWHNGVFTAALIEALDGKADHNGDKLLTVGELGAYLQQMVVEQTNGAQKPDLVSSENEGSMVICAHGNSRQAVTVKRDASTESHSKLSTEDRSDLQPLLDRMAALRCKHASSAEQQRHLLQLLPMIRDGASVDVVAPDDPYRRTALHYSCAIGSLGITKWLVNHRANVNAADANGKTPLSMVGADNRAAITKLLKQHGAGSTAGQAAAAPPEDGPTDPGEQCNLGYKYQYGKDGYKQSYDKAFYWYKKAADQGLAVAINNLGFCYQNGWGCSKSESKAFTCYKQAAELGVPLAMSNLGTCYEFGNGTRANKNLAVEWYRKAARLGNPSAQKHLKRLKLSW